MEAKCEDCGCECGGETGVCPHTGAAQVKQAGSFSTVSKTGGKYSSRWLKSGTLATFDSAAGKNWMSGSLPSLSQCSSGEVAVTFDLCTAYWFSASGGSYSPRFGAKQELVFDSTLCRFIFKDCNGDVWRFTNKGGFDSVKYKDARQTAVTERTSDGKIKKIARTVTQNGKTTTDANVFEYYDGGAAAGLIKQVTFQRSVNPTVGIRRVVYAYYGVDEEHGSAGDLKTATEQLLIGTSWVDKDTSYYRYYKSGEPGGFEHGL